MSPGGGESASGSGEWGAGHASTRAEAMLSRLSVCVWSTFDGVRECVG